jgi:hypothetical protein
VVFFFNGKDERTMATKTETSKQTVKILISGFDEYVVAGTPAELKRFYLQLSDCVTEFDRAPCKYPLDKCDSFDSVLATVRAPSL